MAGGTWVDQNKVRPGVYINYKSAPSSLATMGERGVVAIARVLDWGERGRWYTITDPSDCGQFGHAITDAECLFIRQILLGSNRTQGASKILLWSLNTPDESGERAKLSFKNADGNNVVVYSGDYYAHEANELSLAIENSSGSAVWKVYKGSSTTPVASQTITNLSQLNSTMKEYVEPSLESGSPLAYGDSGALPKTKFTGGLEGGNAAIAFLHTPSEEYKVTFTSSDNKTVTVTLKDSVTDKGQYYLKIVNDENYGMWTLYKNDTEVVAKTSHELSEIITAMADYITITPSDAEPTTSDYSAGLPKTQFVGVEPITVGLFAKYFGTFGNRLSIVITATEDSKQIVQTLLDGQLVDSQVISKIGDLVENDYFKTWTIPEAAKNKQFVETIGTSFAGGSNGEASVTNYSAFLDALELEQFNIAIYDGTNQTIKDAFIDFVKRLSNNEGAKCQAVVSDSSPNPDNECVINCYPQALTLSDGSQLSASELTWWVGGAEAGANVNESLTYVTHPNAVDFQPKLNSAAQVDAINAGKIALISNKGNVQVLTDINSFRTYAVEKGKAFSKNRVVRTVFGLCNDIYDVFSQYYIGAVSNDEEGRKSLKGEIIGLMNRYQGARALQNVEADDVTVLKGNDSDAVVIEIYCQPVDSIEKIYVNITIS